MAAVDPWNDGWESVADREAAEANNGASNATARSSSGSSTTSNSTSSASQSCTGPKILTKKVAQEEENRMLWEAANATNPFEILPSASAANKVVTYKPELKILKRAPQSIPTQSTSCSNSETPTIVDRKEKERRYAEARERLFGPASSTPTNTDTSTSISTTPTTGMSRTSSSSGLVTQKNGESGSGTSTPSRERGGGMRGAKKGGRGNNSGNNTPRSRSPGGKVGSTEKREKSSDLNRTSGILGGITKVTENGWVYTGTGQGVRNSTPPVAKFAGERVDSRIGSSTSLSAISSGMMSMNLNQPVNYNPSTGGGLPITPGTSNNWGNGGLHPGPGAGGSSYAEQLRLHPQPGYIPPKFPQQQQFFTQTQPAPQYTQYPALPTFGSQNHSFQQQQQPVQKLQSFQGSAPNISYNMLSQQHLPFPPVQSHQQSPVPSPLGNYSRQISHNPPRSSSLPPPMSPSRYEQNGGPQRTVYLQDPLAFAPRPPPPQGNLPPGFGNQSVVVGSNTGDVTDQVPIRTPRGPDSNLGKGFAGRRGRGGRLDT
ncbi:hypothetical protein BDZ91DRAFT_711844 [Kalaharituber pfeilii]|nr:hypothetical protein BDZ91DRAFT_711844 [Kalaharituber pfeilii]